MSSHRLRQQPDSIDPLLAYVIETLVATGGEILHVEPGPDGAFRLSWEDKLTLRFGVAGVLLPLHANGEDPSGATATVVMPGVPDGACPCDADPFGLFTPVLLGIDRARSLFVAFDPTRHFPEDEPLAVTISGGPLRLALAMGWHAWEREEYERDGTGFAETLVGFSRRHLVRYFFFERNAAGVDTGPRQRMAEMFYEDLILRASSRPGPTRSSA